MHVHRISASIGAVVLVTVGLLLAGPSIANASSPSTTNPPTTTGRAYPGDPTKEAAIVATENQRLYDLKAITAAARWRGITTTFPYEVTLGSIPTLVLVAQSQPYTITDLEELIPSAFVKTPDGAYLLSDDIVVQAGATLSLSNPDGMQLHLESSTSGFVSIIGMGGKIDIEGSAKSPVTIEAWDPMVGAADTTTSDGRAYVRVIGGSAKIAYARLTDLGFWSGGTGGLALTGTETSADDTGQSSSPAQTTVPGVPSKDGTVHGSNVQSLQPDGTISDAAQAVQSANGQYSYVSASVTHTTVTGDAYGLYVNGSDGVTVSNSTFNDNLVDGIVFHRFVTNSTVSATTADGNAVDGFDMTRASTGVILTGLTTNDNGRDGVLLDGGSLASGPNSDGVAVATYGNNALLNSTSENNARYGVNVEGGLNIRVVGNKISSNFTGIVVSHAAKKVTLTSNEVTQSTQHGISLVDGTTASTVEDNSIQGADIGVYLRDAGASVLRNTISGVTIHGVTFVGTNRGSNVDANVVSGSGPSAIDTSRGSGIVVGGNPSPLWQTTKPLSVIILGIFQPLTVLWIFLGLVVLVSAISGIGRNYKGFRHPYADQAPLDSLTKGVVEPESLGLGKAAAASSEAPVVGPSTGEPSISVPVRSLPDRTLEPALQTFGASFAREPVSGGLSVGSRSAK